MPKILPKPLFDPKKPVQTKIMETASPIVGFAEGGTVGPAGRSFDQITGTAYLSEAERRWYLNQLAARGASLGSDAETFLRSGSNQGLNRLQNKQPTPPPAPNPVEEQYSSFYSPLNRMESKGNRPSAAPAPIFTTPVNPLQGGLALDEAIRTYERDQQGINELETMSSGEQPEYVTAPEGTLLSRIQQGRQGGSAYGEIPGKALAAYSNLNEQTAIPGVTPALRKISGAVGDVAQVAGDAADRVTGTAAIRDLAESVGLPKLPSTGDVASFIGENIIPTTGLEIGTELIPGGMLSAPARNTATRVGSRVGRGVLRGQQNVGDFLMDIAQRTAGVEFAPGSTFAGIPISSPRAQKAIRTLRRIADGESVSPEELQAIIEDIRWAKDENYVMPKNSPEANMSVAELSDVLAKELDTSMAKLPTPVEEGLVKRAAPPTAPPPAILETEGIMDDVVAEVATPAPKRPRKAKAPALTPEQKAAKNVLDEYRANPNKTTPNTTLANMDRVLDPLGREVNPRTGKPPRSRKEIADQIEARLSGTAPAEAATPEAPSPVRTTGTETPSRPDPNQVEPGVLDDISDADMAAIERGIAEELGTTEPSVKFVKSKTQSGGFEIKQGSKVRAFIKKTKDGWRIIDPTGATYPGTKGFRTLAEARDDARSLFDGVPADIAKKKNIPNPKVTPVVPIDEALPTPNAGLVRMFNGRVQTNPWAFNRWTLANEKTVDALINNLETAANAMAPELLDQFDKIRTLVDMGKLDDAQREFHAIMETVHRRMADKLGVPYEQGAALPVPGTAARPEAEDIADVVAMVDREITKTTGEIAETTTKTPKKKAPAKAKTAKATTAKTTEVKGEPLIEGGTIEGIPAPVTSTVRKNANGSFTVTAKRGTELVSETNVKMANPELAERYANQLAKRFDETFNPAGGGSVPPPDPPLGEIGHIPDPEGGAGYVPPSRLGHSIVGGLRDFGAVMGEVIPATNRVAKLIVGKTGVNPSVLADTIPGKALVAYTRQRIAARELTSVALSQLDAIDSFKKLFRPDADGFVTDSKGVRALWNDVFENPSKYALTDTQKEWVETASQIVTEVENLRQAAGLRPRNTSFNARGGELWFPRQVEEIRGAGKDFLKSSNPNKKRFYESVEEGYKNGVRYKADPRSVIETYMSQGYNDIVLAQMNNALEPISRAPSELLPARIVKARTDAIALKQKWLREVNRLRWNRATTNDFPEYKKAKKWHDKLTVAEAELQRAKDVHRDAVAAYNKAASQLSDERTTTRASQLFGEQGQIAIGRWRGRFFKEADYKVLSKSIDSITGASLEKTATPLAAVRNVGDLVRLLSATADFGAPFIQGLPVLAQDPIGWADATIKHYRAFFDPRVQGKFIRSHLDTFNQMAAHGVPIGDIEVFKALHDTGTLARRVTGAIPGARHFEASYSTFLAISKAHLWEGLTYLNPTDRARYIRQLTGSLDTAALGVGANQRAIESAALAFSPRLFRSTTALVWQAADFGSAAQLTAIKNLGTMAAGATMLTFGLGYALGMSPEEMFDRKTGILNPLSGKEFLSVKMGDNWVGVGGQVRAIAQFMTKSADAIARGDPGVFFSADIYDNPLLAFYVSRGAPFLNVAGGAVEAFTNWDTLPYNRLVERDASLADRLGAFGKFAATAILPFSIQSLVQTEGITGDVKALLKGEITFAEFVKDTVPAGITAGTEFYGLRSSVETPGERRAELIPDLVGKAVDEGKLPAEVGAILENVKNWSDLTSRERKVLAPYYEQTEPGLLQKLEAESVASGNVFAIKRQEVVDYKTNHKLEYDNLWEDFLNGASGGEPAAIRERFKDFQKLLDGASAIYTAETTENKKYQAAVDALPATDFNKLTDAYYAVFDKYTTVTDPAIRAGLINADQRRIIEQAEQTDPALGARLRFNVGMQEPDPSDPVILQQWAKTQPVLDAYYNVPSEDRADWRANNPDADVVLWFWGFVSTLKSPQAVEIANQNVRNRVIDPDY